MAKWHLIVCSIFLLIVCSGCINYYESPKSGISYPSQQTEVPQTQLNNPNYQTPVPFTESGCPPSTSNCNFIRGAENQITIQCNDGRQYMRGTAGQITIQYPGKQINVAAAGQETIQGFDYNEAHCLIQWLKNS